MRVLAITPIFPNRIEPDFGPFNRQQFKQLIERGDAELKVLCSVPYLPLAKMLGRPKRAAEMGQLGKSDEMHGIETHYLRRLYVPKIGVPVGVPLYLTSLAPHHSMLKWADVILGTWAYPDGCASVLAAKALGKPVAVKVHGSDMNVLAKIPVARAVMRQVLPRADALITVSRAMGDILRDELGVPADKIHLVPNGIDRSVFGSLSREAARNELGVAADTRLILYVGRIEPQKGFAELIEAFEKIPDKDVTLAVVGDGVWRAKADEAKARIGDRLLILGGKPLKEIAKWMAACDVFTLPSHAEGTPNVLLEALSSGRAAVATRVGGIPDVIEDGTTGILVPPKDASALAKGLIEALSRTWSESALKAKGPVSWSESAGALGRVLQSIRA